VERVFYSVFANDRIYLVFTNNSSKAATIDFTESLEDLETGEKLTKATLKPRTVRIMVKA